jgi:hypothetical protein
MLSLVSVLAILMRTVDSVVSASEATLAFPTVVNVSAVDERRSATATLVTASAVATTLVARIAIGVRMVTTVIHGQAQGLGADLAIVQVVEEVDSNMETPVDSIHAPAR